MKYMKNMNMKYKSPALRFVKIFTGFTFGLFHRIIRASSLLLQYNLCELKIGRCGLPALKALITSK